MHVHKLNIHCESITHNFNMWRHQGQLHANRTQTNLLYHQDDCSYWHDSRTVLGTDAMYTGISASVNSLVEAAFGG